jgi:hypothetical protein
MTGWQLMLAGWRGQVERVEVRSLRCSGYSAQVVLSDGSRQVLVAGEATLWPSLARLKARLRSCGVRQMLLLQPESHDEIIGRPALRQADPGLWVPLR